MKQLLMGNEAFAHAALEAGVRVVAGYPGTPSSELIETVARRHAEGSARGVHVEWSTNEKAALELLAGAAYCGARTLFTCKQVGLNVASDPLMSLNYVGVRGGTVLFVADDPGPISSQTEQDTRRFGSFAKVPVLDPATPEQGFSMMQAAFELSERYGTPVIVRPTTRVCHASAFFDVADATEARPVPDGGFQKDPRWVIFPKRAWEAHGEINERLRAMADDFAHDPRLAAFNPVEEGGDWSAVRPDAPDGPEETRGEKAAHPAPATLSAAPAGDRIAAPGACSSADPASTGGLGASAARSGVPCPGAPTQDAPAPRPLGIVAGGVSAAYVRDALALIAREAAAAGVVLPPHRLIQVGTPYPFPADAVRAFAAGLGDIVVFEELDSVLEDELLRLAGHDHAPWRVRGRYTGDARDRGENDADDIARRLARLFDERAAVASVAAGAASASAPATSAVAAGAASAPIPATHAVAAEAASAPTPASPVPTPAAPASSQTNVSRETFNDRITYQITPSLTALVESALVPADAPAYDGPLPVRPPVLCAGCPHRGSFYAVKRALRGRDAVLCGDIGCYTLGNAMPLDAVDTCLCMGAGITMAQGFAVAEPHKKTLAFVGDSTFFASGLTGIANAVYNGHDVTVVVLDNATTAMTGSQPHPGTGVTLMGPRRDPIDIEGLLRALGVRCITTADPLQRDQAEAAAAEAIAFEGPSAVIFRSPCIQLVKPRPAAAVDRERCTGCKKCITEIGCPGIGFSPDAEGPASRGRGQAFVDDSLCNGCGLCVQICPFDALACGNEPVPAPAVAGDVTEAESAGILGDAADGEQSTATASAMPTPRDADHEASAKGGRDE